MFLKENIHNFATYFLNKWIQIWIFGRERRVYVWRKIRERLKNNWNVIVGQKNKENISF